MRAAVLFSGVGGWELALEQLGIETVWAAEWDPWKADRYRERFAGPIVTDPHVLATMLTDYKLTVTEDLVTGQKTYRAVKF